MTCLASPFSEDSDSDDGLAPSPFSSPGSSSSSSSSQSSEDDLLSPSPLLLPTPPSIFDSFYYFDHALSPIPDSPRYRAVDLPTLENDIKVNRLGLGFHSTSPSYPFEDFHCVDEVPPPLGISQRTTWLSLPGADTDDDLIPAELGSKTYIPDPSITILTTPPSPSLLIWDPTTRSGLPPGLPSFDGTGHTGYRFDVDALSIGRPHSPEDDFDVDAALLAQDAENDVEVQKLCELKQRTNMAAVAACKGGEGAQPDAERVRERFREVTALLRLKLMSSDETAKSRGVGRDAKEHIVSGVAEENGNSQPSRIVQRRTSKPKITSMAQLVANMVFHRQQDVLRRSPVRSRTWSPVTSTMHPTASGKTRSWTQTSPTSPLRQMILPEDLDNISDPVNCDTKDCAIDSPIQLSPLCLAIWGSPESFYDELDATSSIPLSTSE